MSPRGDSLLVPTNFLESWLAKFEGAIQDTGLQLQNALAPYIFSRSKIRARSRFLAAYRYWPTMIMRTLNAQKIDATRVLFVFFLLVRFLTLVLDLLAFSRRTRCIPYDEREGLRRPFEQRDARGWLRSSVRPRALVAVHRVSQTAALLVPAVRPLASKAVVHR